MKRYDVGTDFNGLVIFAPDRLRNFYQGEIAEGTDLFSRFTTLEEGDEMLKRGIIIPILAIDDGGYGVEFYVNEKSARPADQIVFENGVFPLQVERRLVVADLAVLKEWVDDLDWIDVDLSPGAYAATVRGFHQKNSLGHLVDAGYEIHLTPTETLPELTATLEINAKVFRLDT
jgi:hypothetical protein